MDEIPVTHFGLHRHDNMVFLHQQTGGRCVTPGLDGLDSPLIVQTARRFARCPHNFTETEEGPLVDHPMAVAMGPIQAGLVFYLPLEHERWAWRLSHMIPSVTPIMVPFWTISPPRDIWAANQLGLTNLAPLVLADTATRDIGEITRIARAPRVRNLIVSGPMPLPGAIPLDPTGLPEDHDWAAEGRRQLHRLITRSEP